MSACYHAERCYHADAVSIPDQRATEIAERAREQHVHFTGAVADFAEHLCQLAAQGHDLEEIRGADLYVAWCCAGGCNAALQHFWESAVPTARKAALSVTKREDLAEDVMQEVLQRLIVGSPEKPGTLASYQGRSKLVRWLRSVTVRAAIAASKKSSHNESTESEDQLAELPHLDDDPELALLKERSGEMVERALREALRELDSETRLVLQQHLIDGLTIDQLGKVYRIHRATAARRVAKAREALLSATRQKLRQESKRTGSELDSLINFAQSRVKLSLRWFSATGAEE